MVLNAFEAVVEAFPSVVVELLHQVHILQRLVGEVHVELTGFFALEGLLPPHRSDRGVTPVVQLGGATRIVPRLHQGRVLLEGRRHAVMLSLSHHKKWPFLLGSEDLLYSVMIPSVGAIFELRAIEGIVGEGQVRVGEPHKGLVH